MNAIVVLSLRQYQSILARLIITPSGCWEWTGARDQRGYGRAGYGPRRAGTGLVHRMVYQQVNGPVDDGLELDHLCRNPPCANPAHLEPVTHRENILRGEGPARLGGKGNGDIRYRFLIDVPSKLSPEQEEAVDRLSDVINGDPRAKLFEDAGAGSTAGKEA